MKLQGDICGTPRVWCTDSPGAHRGLSSHTPYCPAIINNQRSNAPSLQELWPYVHPQARFLPTAQLSQVERKIMLVLLVGRYWQTQVVSSYDSGRYVIFIFNHIYMPWTNRTSSEALKINHQLAQLKSLWQRLAPNTCHRVFLL